MSDDLKGTVFNGRYTILERIGAGGMATVYRARDEKSSAFVAIKILSRDFLDRNPKEAERNLRRFKREAEILRILDGSPHVVDYVEHACSEGGDWFIAMELLEGEQLSHFIRRGKDVLPVHTLLHYGVHLVEGLKEIHKKQILHRDLAPDNVVLVKDADGIRVPKFLDFGIGKSIGGELDQVTEMLTIMGKPQYFSPEQARGLDLTTASDVYSLGVILYQMVTGHVPLEIRGIPDFKKIQQEAPIPIESYREGQRIPPELQGVVMRCLAKTAEDRPLLDEILEVLHTVRERANAGEEFDVGSDTGPTSDYTAPVAIRTEIELAEGDTINRYVIKRLVGRGGMGAVYEAWDPDLRRKVALKVATQIEEEKAKKRVLNEARASAALRCENIVTIYDAGTDGGTPYISMEFVEGKTLAQVIEEEGPLSGQRFWELAHGLCEGLSLAHEREEPVIHRDLKPANVLVHRHIAKITDFGIAKVTKGAGAQGPDTGGHDVGGGTAATMSPEQINEQPVDHRSDLYSLGCVLYMMATGRGPFQGNQIAIVYQHCNAEPTPPSKIAATTPSELDRIILKLLSKEPEDRYQSATEVLDDLRAVFAPDEVPARPWYRSPLTMVAGVAVIISVITVIQALTSSGSGGGGGARAFGIHLVGQTKFDSQPRFGTKIPTYYVGDDFVAVEMAGPEGTVFDTVVRAVGVAGENSSQGVLSAGKPTHKFPLLHNRSDAPTTYEVTITSQTEQKEITFAVIHDPTKPVINVITHGGYEQDAKRPVRALYPDRVVFEIIEEESGFDGGEEAGRITNWRSDGAVQIDDISLTRDEADSGTWALTYRDLTGVERSDEVEIVPVVPTLKNATRPIRTNEDNYELTLDLACPPFDLSTHRLADGDVQLKIGEVTADAKFRDGRYVADIDLAALGGGTSPHRVTFAFDGRPMAEELVIIHDKTPPTLSLTYDRGNGNTQTFDSLESPPTDRLQKLSIHTMASLFKIKAKDDETLGTTAKVTYSSGSQPPVSRQIRIADGSVELFESIPRDATTFDVTVAAKDLTGNEGTLKFTVEVVGANVSDISVNELPAADKTFYVPHKQALAVSVSVTGTDASEDVFAVLQDPEGNEITKSLLKRDPGTTRFSGTVNFQQPEARRGTLVVKTGTAEIQTYAVVVDRDRPTVVTRLYGRPSGLGSEIVAGRFPPIVIAAGDAGGRIRDLPSDLTIDTLEGDALPDPVKQDTTGGVTVTIAGPAEGRAGKWRIRYKTQDFAGWESEPLECVIEVRPPRLLVTQAGALPQARIKEPRQFESPRVPTPKPFVQLTVANVASGGRYSLAYKRPGDADFVPLNLFVEGGQPTPVRVPVPQDDEGEVSLYWYEFVGDEIETEPQWFDTVRWRRDRTPPDWFVKFNGVEYRDKAALKSNGLLVVDLSEVSLHLEDDTGFPEEFIFGELPAHDPKRRPRTNKVILSFHDEANWSEHALDFEVRDLAGRQTKILLRLIQVATAPKLKGITADVGCRERDEEWVARSGNVTLTIENHTQRVNAVLVEVSGPDHEHTQREAKANQTFQSSLKLPKDGVYDLILRAERENQGPDPEPFARARVRVDTQAPKVVITHREAQASGGSIEVEKFEAFGARVSDDHLVERVEWKLGTDTFRTTLPSSPGTYRFTGRPLKAGTYPLVVRATDYAGNRSVETVLSVTVKPAVAVKRVPTLNEVKSQTLMNPVPIVRGGKTAFRLSETEATVGQFKQFWNRVKGDLDNQINAFRSDLRSWPGLRTGRADDIDRGRIQEVLDRNLRAGGGDDLPLRWVYFDVAAFFAWGSHGRLPTAKEWKDAAGLILLPDAEWIVFMDGSRPRSYATAFTRRTSKYRGWRNYAGDGGRVKATGELAPDGSFRLRGLAGNVAEWVAEYGTMGGSYRDEWREGKGNASLKRRPRPADRRIRDLEHTGLRILWPKLEGGR